MEYKPSKLALIMTSPLTLDMVWTWREVGMERVRGSTLGAAPASMLTVVIVCNSTKSLSSNNAQNMKETKTIIIFTNMEEVGECTILTQGFEREEKSDDNKFVGKCEFFIKFF